MEKCYICGSSSIKDVSKENGWENRYRCELCGYVALEPELVSKLDWHFNRNHISGEACTAICIALRNEFENSGQKVPNQNNTMDDLIRKFQQYTSLDAVDKMNAALLALSRMENTVGDMVKLNPQKDYPFFQCLSSHEMVGVLRLLSGDGFISAKDPFNPHVEPRITAKGYQRLRELKQPNTSTNQCFVAMWFGAEMGQVYKDAIKPAIEYKENGESVYKALRIDWDEHIEDINDRIIAQIRRSKFMVCDLTGYRGGVYFEAGFAQGLGIPVIYTCREDWTREEVLKIEPNGNEVQVLYDSHGQPIRVRKEGVHFDLEHRNRIQWNPNDLDDLRTRLENRIKAVII